MMKPSLDCFNISNMSNTLQTYLYLSLCIYACIHICIHTYTYTYVYTYIYIYIYVHICPLGSLAIGRIAYLNIQYYVDNAPIDNEHSNDANSNNA